MQVFSIDIDKVINSCFITCKANYSYAIDHVVPLMQKLNMQRKMQNPKFYERLGNDIIRGCIMPPLTLAFIEVSIDNFKMDNIDFFSQYIHDNINRGFVLDGIQRLNTLKRVSSRDGFDPKFPIFFNILICPSYDKLLYRMITLNNGQKPMTARHQIEILLENVYEFDNDNISIICEKQAIGANARGTFKKSSFISSYLAFLSDTTNIDNKKIIESKLDELLALKIIEKGASDTHVEYKDVVNMVAKFSQNSDIKKWFQNENNLIGFSVAMRDKRLFGILDSMEINEFSKTIHFFDEIFMNTNKSQVRVGSFRRILVYQYFKNLEHINQEQMEPIEALSWLIDKVD